MLMSGEKFEFPKLIVMNKNSRVCGSGENEREVLQCVINAQIRKMGPCKVYELKKFKGV
jgi:hypothetical protein